MSDIIVAAATYRCRKPVFKKNYSRAGLTLLEVIMALALFAAVIVMLMPLFSQLRQGSALATPYLALAQASDQLSHQQLSAAIDGGPQQMIINEQTWWFTVTSNGPVLQVIVASDDFRPPNTDRPLLFERQLVTINWLQGSDQREALWQVERMISVSSLVGYNNIVGIGVPSASGQQVAP